MIARGTHHDSQNFLASLQRDGVIAAHVHVARIERIVTVAAGSLVQRRPIFARW